MRCEWMLVFVFAAMLVVPVAADSQGWIYGPTEISFNMGYTYNESKSQEIRATIDEFFGDNNSVVNQTEVDAYLDMIGGLEAFESNWTIDGLKNSSSTGSFDIDNVLGDVNATTLVTETMTFTWTYSTTTADEHTIVIPYEGGGGDVNDTVDISMETETGWYFKSVSNSALTISTDGTELEVTQTDMVGITDDITIVITNVAPSSDDPGDDDDDDDDDTPGFEMIAVVGAMAVALIAVRRRR